MASARDEGALEAPGVESDLRRLLAVQAIRAFLYGFGTVVLGTALVRRGFSSVQIGLLLTAMLAGMAITAVLVGILGDRMGRRRSYGVLLALMGVVGAGFALTGNVWLLLLLALTGVMSTDANESGPITTLEQAMIGQAPADVRLHVFGRYNAVAYLAGALGALAAGGPAFLHRVWHAAPTAQTWLLVFPVGAVACLAIVRGLSDRVEVLAVDGAPRRTLERSRRSVFTLAGLFAVDSFAGGFVVTTFLVTWFETRFGASPELMSLVIFAAGILQAGSSILATRVAGRFGLLNTMVFTHLPSNVLLILVPLMPTLGASIAVLLGRFALSQMDVPTRQAYVAGMVDPKERTAAAAATNTARYVSRPVGPLVGGLLQHVAVAAPFVAAGAIKSVYDLALWRVFRRVELPDA
ncbi:MAG: MFS transporter [Planctomycetaceae bacterium]